MYLHPSGLLLEYQALRAGAATEENRPSGLLTPVRRVPQGRAKVVKRAQGLRVRGHPGQKRRGNGNAMYMGNVEYLRPGLIAPEGIPLSVTFYKYQFSHE